HDVPSGRGVFWQPCTASQESMVHGLLSSQLSAGMTVWQWPSVPQASTPLQTLLSVHLSGWSAVLHGHVYVCSQPATGSQLSVVQAFPSLQLSGDPLTHDPLTHVSFPLQTFPSGHGVPLVTFVC